MAVTTTWSPNQAAVAQVETYTFSAPNSIGNTYIATINGKSVTYASVSGDTATTCATGLYSLLNTTTGIAAEFTEITWSNPSAGVIRATASTPGTPFANLSGGSTSGLVLSTGNGLANGITTAHTTANKSPSDVNDAQNWLRTNLATTPPSFSRALPANGDDVIISNSATPLLWNLDQLAAVQFNSYQRWQSQTGVIGLSDTNANGYAEWRARDFRFSGPQGSVPSGGLTMTLGASLDAIGGSGPAVERYNVGSQKVSLQILDGNDVRFLGVHTDNTISALGSVRLSVAAQPGEVAQLNSVSVYSSASVTIGAGVTWTTSTGSVASSMTCYGGAALMNAAPATLVLNSGAQVAFLTTGITWASISAQGGCRLSWLAGGVITSLTMTTGCALDKSQDARPLTITNSTIDGDSCSIIDPLNAITFTNATTVKQQVSSGPIQFTGTRTIKVT